jgi:hypothetical protein
MIRGLGFLPSLLSLQIVQSPDRTYHPNRHISSRQTGTSDRKSNGSGRADGRLTLNLKAKEGQDIARKLVEDADVFVEN